MKIKKQLVVAAFGALMVPSQAASVAIVNAGFEDDVIGGVVPGGFPQASGWDNLANSARVTAHASFAPADEPASLGDAFVFTQGTTDPATQTLGTVFVEDGIYNLASFVTNNGDNPDIIYEIGWDNGGTFTLVSGGSATIDVQSLPGNSVGNASWVQTPGVTSDPVTGAAVGQPIVIRVQSSVSQGIWFDNVALDVIPEPGSTLLLGLAGFVGLIRRRR